MKCEKARDEDEMDIGVEMVLVYLCLRRSNKHPVLMFAGRCWVVETR